MNIEELRTYCLAKSHAEETLPFGPDTLVYKVGNKMFAAIGLNDEETRINLKCDPDKAEELRDQYPDIIPGYHMSKKHWNTVYCEREVEDEMICGLIDHSYELVFGSLSKKIQKALGKET
jgi:predicted DNA-binding protein (MmcQ/YjbR family)